MAGRTTNTDAIRELERLVAVHNERIETLREEVGWLAGQVEQSPPAIDRLKESHSEQGKFQARLDERLKHVESRLERRWNLLLALASGLVGVILGHVLRNP